ncbi:hypothetical protein AB1Y20_018331 [Prymnesium parvum]|uniref:GH18 domain-containing protein n=1 Tax=Prymnesium parvum TaxID=97485 RepID=A0AB34JRD5_PRYPA
MSPPLSRLQLALTCFLAALGAWLGSSSDPDLLLAWATQLLRPSALPVSGEREERPSDERHGPLPSTVYARGLVNRRVRAASVLHEHQAFFHNTSSRAFAGVAVGFASPWAARADETVWRFSRKLTHVAPVLFEATAAGGVRSTIGEHAGRRWLRWLRAATRSAAGRQAWPRLTPLVSLERLDLLHYFTGEGAEARAGELLLSLQTALLTMKLDGFVLHAHAHLAWLTLEDRRLVQPKLHVFVQLLAAQLSGEDAELLLLVPPHPGLFSATEFNQLHEALGGVILATANFSAVKATPGPSAPISWMKRALTELNPSEEASSKLAVTLPMVGWDFALPDGPGTPVDSQRYLRLLSRHKNTWLEWDAAGSEHVFKYHADGVEHALYYASLRGLAERLGVLRQLKVGFAIWELGTTLDYFYDLL